MKGSIFECSYSFLWYFGLLVEVYFGLFRRTAQQSRNYFVVRSLLFFVVLVVFIALFLYTSSMQSSVASRIDFQ